MISNERTKNLNFDFSVKNQITQNLFINHEIYINLEFIMEFEIKSYQKIHYFVIL